MINQAIKGMTALEQAKTNTAKTEGLNIINQQAQAAQMQNIMLQNQIDELKDEVSEYRKLLCKPMLEIANGNRNFKATYDAQMQLMADWMTSQKAFKELAIEFGFEKGLSHEDVMEMGMDKKIDVLENKNNPKHGTNADTSEIISKRTEELINKYKKDRSNKK